MKRALVVTPNWPPLSFPDMHRVRMALPFFRELGWEPLILKIDPSEQGGTRDPALEATIPPATRVWQAGCVPGRVTRWIGLHHVGVRSLAHLAALGSRIIRRERPAVAFFSTTMFPVFILGRYWRWKHGLPYVLDFQDPWRRDDRGADRSRSHPWKHRLSDLLARILEPPCVKAAAHVMCVSAAYPEDLRRRYRAIQPERFSVLPFGGPQHDFDVLAGLDVSQSVFDPKDGQEHWVYVGRGGADLALALRSLFTALRTARRADPDRLGQLRLHFIGTDYASGSRATRTVAPIAAECGVGDLVDERPERLPYFEAMKCLQDAHALVVPGSTDPGYTASKIYPYILAGKPLLAVFHQRSSVVEVLHRTRAGTIVTFTAEDSCERIAERIGEAWLGRRPSPPATDWAAFDAYTARQMTRRLCARLDAVAAESSPGV